MTGWVRARIARALDRRFGALDARLAGTSAEVEASRRELAEVRDAVAENRAALAELHAAVTALEPALGRIQARVDDDEALGLLRALVLDDAGNRRRLEALRAAPSYALPYDHPDPLVSICIATRADRTALLLERALPSALAQTHPSIEVVIVGDGFDPRSDPRLAAIDDPRVRFGDLTHRIAGPDPDTRWLVGATLPRQESRRLARGLWITDLDDDDALRPDAVEGLLELARDSRAEVVSGLLEQHAPEGGDPRVISGFPPGFSPDWSGLPADWGHRACTAALWHEGLRFFVRLHLAETLGVPGDLFLTIRMARAGVRFAQLDRPVYDYFPGRLWDRSTPAS